MEVRLWPRSSVTGSIARTLDDAQSAKFLRAQISTPPGAQHRIEADVLCPVTRGRWTCDVPATAIDLRLERDGFAPVYLWNVNADRGATVRAGELRFARGASIAGWVTLPLSERPEVSVELTPRAESARSNAERRASPSVTRVNQRGFFQFAGIAPGVYEITARSAGWSPAVESGVTVPAGGEVVLRDPLGLTPLASLSITIQPPVAPDSRPWKFTLSRATALSGSYRIVRQETVHDSGFWRSNDVEADRYRLTISDSSGSVFATRELQVNSPSSWELITIHTVRIRGRVVAGGAPVQGRISFISGRSRLMSDADEEGRFHASLPHGGQWDVEVKLPGGAILRARPVKVTETDDGEADDVTITLPGGRVAGSVVTEEGAPVEALVRVRAGSAVKAYAATDRRGRFTIVGVPEERVVIEADAGDYGSEQIEYDAAGAAEREVRIVVPKRRTISLRVVTPDGWPASGAVVRQLMPPYWHRVEKHADADGVVTLRVPAQGTVDAAIFTPGFPLRLVSIGPDVKSGAVVALHSAGGRVRFNEIDSRWPFVAPEGGSFFPVVSLWFRAHAGALPFGFGADGFAPELAPGTYTVCPTATLSEECERWTVRPGDYVRTGVRPVSGKP